MAIEVTLTPAAALVGNVEIVFSPVVAPVDKADEPSLKVVLKGQEQG